MSFQTLKLTEQILKAIKEKGYDSPTPIQAESIPIVLQGKDLLGCAQTGTGKTAAFAIPILQLLSEKKHNNDRKRPIRSLILSPTRELAIQIGESLHAYGKYTGLTSTVVCGGLSKTRQIRALQKGIDILVATPGRLLDLMNEFNISLSKIEVFVLDEADRMLDMGFIHDIRQLISTLPNNKQSLFFSATMEPEIMKLANTILVNPSKVKVTPISSAATSVEQFVYFIDRGNKNDLLLEVLKNEDIKSCLVFTRTKHSADKVVRMLGMNKIRCDAIHGNKSQNARQEALVNFRNKQIRVLVATDIAARGIDIDHLEYVVNYEVPNVAETYVHRIGRTGRAGRNGTALSFCDAEEKSYLRAIERLITKRINIIDQHPFPLIDNNPPKTVQNRQPQGQGQRRAGSGNSSSSATSNGNGRSGSGNRGSGGANGNTSNGGGGNSSSGNRGGSGNGASSTSSGNRGWGASSNSGGGNTSSGNRSANNSFAGGKDSRAGAEDKKHSGKTSPQNRNTRSRSPNNTQASPSSPMSRSNRPMTRSKDSSRTSN